MPSPPGLYVHVPFCVSRCAYCAFCSQTDLSLRGAWLDALERESRAVRPRWGGFDTVYVGGGTPSVLSDADLERLVGLLRGSGVLPEAEWTVEANPDDLDAARLARLRAMGFGRVSVGVQSFDDALLARIGRRHGAEAARRAVAWVREAGFPEVSLDLIHALPGQTLRAFTADLRTALDLGVTHLSAYELTLEPGTPLAERVARREERLPGDAARRRFFLRASEWLAERGWVHYEVSSHAAGPEHRSKHNRKYWTHVPYLGLGPGAHSFDGESRWWNVRSVPEYVRRLSRGESPVDGRERLDASALRLERLALGLRTEDGIALEDARGREAALDRAVREGLLAVAGGRARPTREGMLWADALALRLA